MVPLNKSKVGCQLIIKRMASEELEDIVRLEKESFTDPWPKKGFEVQLEDGSSIMLVARLEDFSAGRGEIAGYLCAYYIFEELQLASVAVKKEFRRQGIARRLISEMIQLGRDRGAKEIWLDVRESNSAARQLYEAFGFREMYRRKNYYRKPKEDALVMYRTVMEAAHSPSVLDLGRVRGR